jgi:ATP-dependent protease ClpP protease subunit
MKNKALICAAAVMACTLLSGHVNINLQHNMHLPKELTNPNIIEDHSHFLGLFHTYHVYTASTFMSERQLTEIKQLLNNATGLDTIVFHIAGDGGEVDATMGLLNDVKTTKAHTIMIVERPSYSGDAFLAVAGDELIMKPYTYLLFHTSSGYGMDCSKEEGIDKAETNAQICQDMLNMHLYNLNKFITEIKILTPDERVAVMTGHTVLIHADEINKRQSTLS